MADVTLELPQTLMLRSLDEHAATRREIADIRGLTLALNDTVQRLERLVLETRRDMHEVTDDIWIMLKVELMGRLGNFETRIEARFDALSEPGS
jgi:hypothetical protein